VNTKISIDKAIGMVATTSLDVNDKIIASMIETLLLLKELGFKHISKGDEDEE
jgi:hypothetical protein